MPRLFDEKNGDGTNQHPGVTFLTILFPEVAIVGVDRVGMVAGFASLLRGALWNRLTALGVAGGLRAKINSHFRTPETKGGASFVASLCPQKKKL